jgi:hypothetical protein
MCCHIEIFLWNLGGTANAAGEVPTGEFSQTPVVQGYGIKMLTYFLIAPLSTQYPSAENSPPAS